MTPSAVASSGSTKPEALPMATTLSTQSRSERPVRNFTTRGSPATFAFFRRNSASAASSERKCDA